MGVARPTTFLSPPLSSLQLFPIIQLERRELSHALLISEYVFCCFPLHTTNGFSAFCLHYEATYLWMRRLHAAFTAGAKTSITRCVVGACMQIIAAVVLY